MAECQEAEVEGIKFVFGHCEHRKEITPPVVKKDKKLVTTIQSLYASKTNPPHVANANSFATTNIHNNRKRNLNPFQSEQLPFGGFNSTHKTPFNLEFQHNLAVNLHHNYQNHRQRNYPWMEQMTHSTAPPLHRDHSMPPPAPILSTSFNSRLHTTYDHPNYSRHSSQSSRISHFSENKMADRGEYFHRNPPNLSAEQIPFNQPRGRRYQDIPSILDQTHPSNFNELESYYDQDYGMSNHRALANEFSPFAHNRPFRSREENRYSNTNFGFHQRNASLHQQQYGQFNSRGEVFPPTSADAMPQPQPPRLKPSAPIEMMAFPMQTRTQHHSPAMQHHDATDVSFKQDNMNVDFHQFLQSISSVDDPHPQSMKAPFPGFFESEMGETSRKDGNSMVDGINDYSFLDVDRFTFREDHR